MATKDKAKKKAKLRHAEYYDFQKVQDKLYADSQNGRIFKHLIEIIVLPETYVWHIGISRQIMGVRPLAQMEGQSRI